MKVAMLIEQLAGKESENIRLKKEVKRLTGALERLTTTPRSSWARGIAQDALAGGPPQEGES